MAAQTEATEMKKEQKHEDLLQETVRQMTNMRRVMRLVLQQMRENSEKSMMGEGQYHALHALSECGRMTAGELAEKCHVADPTMSKILKNLEENEPPLIERHTDPTNRRVVLVTVTPEGRQIQEKMVAYFEGSLARVLDPLSDAQLEDLIVAFGHLEQLVNMATIEEKKPLSVS